MRMRSLKKLFQKSGMCLKSLVVRLNIYIGLEKWELMQTVAKMLALYEP